MTIDRISSGPIGPIDRSGGEPRTPLTVGEASARSVARAVVGRIAAELGLTGAGPRTPEPDPYRLRDLADAVVAQFPNSAPAAAGDLSRAIETLASAIAVDMTGHADGRTLERLDAAVSGFAPSSDGVDGVTEFLDEAARRIDHAR